MALLYLDMIKLALAANLRGAEEATGAQYLMFGTYDMLYYALPKADNAHAMKWLEQRHEKRHNLDWNYERHPVYLYCPDVSLFEAKGILNQNAYASRPLVLTMVRISKHGLMGTGKKLDDVLRTLQRQIDASVIRITRQPNTPVVVCWNLGNADFLILSRPSHLTILRDLYLSLKNEGLRIEDGDGQRAVLQFTSFSTYCAFPKGGENNRIDESKLRDWLNKDSKLQFVDFVDSSADTHAIYRRFGESRFLFGDRDYQLFSNIDRDNVQSADSVVAIVREMLDKTSASVIQSSSLIPSLPLGSESKSARPTSKIYGMAWDEAEDMRRSVVSSLESMCELVKGNQTIFERLGNEYISQIKHCINTLDALYKYALRLYAAAYQDDVFSVIRRLYGSMSQILNDCLGYMRRLLEDQKARELREVVSATYVEVMCFVSELQHIYTVLAVSPHSHMETYYGSMRSLNASSKLWVSYNGVAEVLSELFPTHNQDETQDCSVLIVPYREKYSQSGRIVPNLYSKSILVLMQLNYNSMFDIKQTLFVITHELGHYIFNVTRLERFSLMFKTYASTMFTMVFADVFDCPLYFLVHVLETRGKEKSWAGAEEYRAIISRAHVLKKDMGLLRHMLCLNICSDMNAETCARLIDKSSEKLHSSYVNALENIIEKINAEFSKSYNRKKDAIPELKYYYGNDVITTIVSTFCDSFSGYYIEMCRAIAHANVQFLNSVSSYEKLFNVTFDPQQITKLKTYWSYAYGEGLEQASEKVLTRHYLATSGGVILELFREIHADVFACKVIDFKLDDYLDYVSNFAASSPDLLRNDNNMHKVMVVCEAALHDDGCAGLVDWIANKDTCPFDADLRTYALGRIQSISDGPYYKYMKEYGKQVASSVDKRVMEIKLDQKQWKWLKCVRHFVRGGEETLSDMWRFWIRAM